MAGRVVWIDGCNLALGDPGAGGLGGLDAGRRDGCLARQAAHRDWLRGYGNPPPQTLVLVGWRQEYTDKFFTACEVARKVTNSYGVANEGTRDHPDIFICRGLKLPWPQFWEEIKMYS
jgi:hypothetical protein